MRPIPPGSRHRFSPRLRPGAEAQAHRYVSQAPQAAGWLAALYPIPVRAFEVRAERYGELSPALLSEAEWQSIRHAAEPRIRDFVAGRACAHRALEALGIPGFSLLPAPDRTPLWPTGVVGSITHTEGFSAAVVAHDADARSLGVDTEVIEALKPELWSGICAPAELEWLRGLRPPERCIAAAVIFTAKEAFYKCQFPLLHLRLEFRKTRVELLGPQVGPFPITGEFRLHPPAALRAVPAPETWWRGRFQRHGGFLTAAMAWPAVDRVA